MAQGNVDILLYKPNLTIYHVSQLNEQHRPRVNNIRVMSKLNGNLAVCTALLKLRRTFSSLQAKQPSYMRDLTVALTRYVGRHIKSDAGYQ